MEWYCAVWNCDELKSSMGANYIYERICEGDTTLTFDIDVIDEFQEELNEKVKNIEVSRGSGFVIIGCTYDNAEKVYEKVMELSKKHGLSFYEPQNMTYRF